MFSSFRRRLTKEQVSGAENILESGGAVSLLVSTHHKYFSSLPSLSAETGCRGGTRFGIYIATGQLRSGKSHFNWVLNLSSLRPGLVKENSALG